MTAHIEAKKEEIAKTVLMPGDPLRAKYIAENFLDDYKLVNSVRNIYAYTGTYKGKSVTVMASGMGMPSIGIYSYELFKFYDVDNIIRVGSAGAYTTELKLFDVVLATSAFSTSNFAYDQNGCEDIIIKSSEELNEKIRRASDKNNINLIEGTVHSSDVFYSEVDDINELYNNYGCLAVEMESFALFHNANILGKNATCLLTISNSLITNEETTAKERETAFNDMIILALESVGE